MTVDWDDLFQALAHDGEGHEPRTARDGTGVARLLDFGSPVAEFEALRRTAALLPSPAWVSMLITGPDAADYLHRRLTRAVTNLPVGRGVHTLQLEGDAKMTAEFLLYRTGADSFEALVDRDRARAASEETEKFVLMDEVAVEPLWEGEALIGLAGPRAPEILAALLREAGQSAAASDLSENAEWAVIDRAEIAAIPCRIFRDSRWPIPYFHIASREDRLAELAATLAKAGRAAGGAIAGEDALDLLRIEAGIAKFGIDTGPGANPIEAGLETTIDFDKGCFPGQEVLAKINNLGHPAKVLRRFEFEGEQKLENGAPIIPKGQPTPAGFITSACTLPGAGRAAALGYLKWAARDCGQATVEGAQGPIAAKVFSISRESHKAKS